MLLDTLNSEGLLSITSVLGETSDKGVYAFRGDLVLKEGELREGSDRDRRPPEVVISAAAALADESSFVFLNGLMYELEHLSILVEKYKESLKAETLTLIYVENIGEPLKVEYEGVTFNLLPYPGGMVWNELLETLYIEKSDLKGQSAEDKVAVAYDSAKTFDIKADAISYDDALGKTIEVVKDMSVGPV
jgi:hypothetical protein